MNEDKLSNIAIGCAIKIHKALGPGLLESVYQECLYYELTQKGLFVEKEKPLPVIYEDVKLQCGYRIDLFIENKLIVEVKAVDNLNSLHVAQTLTYLRLSNCKLGLLINFNVTLYHLKKARQGWLSLSKPTAFGKLSPRLPRKTEKIRHLVKKWHQTSY